eukprot:CAMPEP_0168609458 /NCGR_PEP_ID=MMETSP0449_2-20121227/1219_1 /TAXON_ID=1082188 /ORGANISM="Strombidium rassoulzadegani, Strain ras09" /LENGTH=126 /DNA_ID=CAMNT_0008649607 /DNA_START=203 /DNA_END=580 /DNA_ORIENTATION=-
MIDAYLDWHHLNIRWGAGGYIFRKYFSGFMDKDGNWSTPEAVQESWILIHKSLKLIQKMWLNGSSTYLFGEEPTIADLSLACELIQLQAIDFPLKEKYARIHKYVYDDMMKIEAFRHFNEEGGVKV